MAAIKKSNNWNKPELAAAACNNVPIYNETRRYFARCSTMLVFICLLLFLSGTILAQSIFEDRPIGEVTIVFSDGIENTPEAEQFRIAAREALGETYTTVKIRDAIERLYRTDQITSASVEAAMESGRVDLRFLLVRKIRARRVNIEVISPSGQSVTEEELLVRLDLLDSRSAVSDHSLRANADTILGYLRERGFLQSEVTFKQSAAIDATGADVTFQVNTGERARMETFDVNIEGFDNSLIGNKLRLKPGEGFTRELLTRDTDRVKEILRDNGFLAPRINEPRVVYDSDTNLIQVQLTGSTGPTIEVVVDAERDRVGSRTQRSLIPIIREGSLDYAAIIEGERRLENHYQEQGYFFVEVTSVCSVDPPLKEGDETLIPNETTALCSSLNSHDLAGRKVTLKYDVDLKRRLRLSDIRLQGTNQFIIDEIKPVLESQPANILGIIPIFGYGRGYTSERLLEEDAATITSLLRELGYRNATVRVNQGASLDGESLIITFIVDEGEPTVISDVSIEGNTAFSEERLKEVLPKLVGENFSRTKMRNGQRSLSEFYSEAGYYDASVEMSIDERTTDTDTGEQYFNIVYRIVNEGKPVYVDRILIAGNETTKSAAILKALSVKPGQLLTARDVYSSEQALYSSDAFSNVEIRLQPAGEMQGGTGRKTDILINLQEQKPRIIQFGGGFSTDVGFSGFTDIRHFNLLGNLWQGGSRIQLSQRRQLIGIDFINPRFLRDARRNSFAPLTITAQYQRDSTVTRFFRSAFDRGTFGIVQRLDPDGNPIDEFGNPTGDPTLNRLTVQAESQRTLNIKSRTVLYFRYKFEHVRLYNIQSLLVKELLEPDANIRTSGFGATIVRDTRQRCGIEYTILDIIERGGPGDPCRYNASDPTDGDYFTAEYNVSVPFLGSNIGFHKFQASYSRYYTLPWLRNTTLAARGILGMANVFSHRERFSSAQFPELEGVLPISERFFAGGSLTLRGFEFESAGPRVVVAPQGQFIDRNGEPVFLDPFTIPFGGNALAILNLEARVPLSDLFRIVPFYDGGNVFHRVKDIFKPPTVDPNDAFRQNLRALWSHTVGLGLRLKTPIGSEIGVDYGYLLNPPTFIIPQQNAPPAFQRLQQGRFHFRYSQTF